MAIILGVGGQDGYFMCQLLASRGFDIHGVLFFSDFSSSTIPYNVSTLLVKNVRKKVLGEQFLLDRYSMERRKKGHG